jgi:hypothetical protein
MAFLTARSVRLCFLAFLAAVPSLLFLGIGVTTDKPRIKDQS